MSDPKVINLRDFPGHKAPPGAVRIDRRSKWGNPFPVNRGRPRAQAIENYRAWLYAPAQSKLLAQARRELRGQDLACWCAPLPCHGDVLLAAANEGAQ
jgi:hypothetical protein